MILNIILLIIVILILYSMVAGIYQIFLALSYYVTKEEKSPDKNKANSFAILVPAHNEELLIEDFLVSLNNLEYEESKYEVIIVADNCTDRTVEICKKYPIKTLEREDDVKKGKGYALEWAMEQINIEEFDAVIVIDADTIPDKYMLSELNRLLNQNEVAIQCYIDVPNKNESWFTRLIYLSRTINDLFYHYAKYKLGLSAYLMGTGMCFSTSLLRKMKWNAFTLSEDWEYYAMLIQKGNKVAFSRKAIVHQQESSSLKQATSQRLRWASGRFYVVKSLGLKLLVKGIKERNVVMADASLALLLPNWSLQVNLILLSILPLLLLPKTPLVVVMLFVCLFLLAIQAAIVLLGVAQTEDPWETLKSAFVAPVFLIWKLIIDFLCVTNLYKGKEWIRTSRHKPKS